MNIRETVTVTITIIIIKVVQNLMNGLEEENNTKPVEANCLHPGTIFSHFEEIMNANNWQIISFTCVHFLLSPWGRRNSKMAPKIPGPWYMPPG